MTQDFIAYENSPKDDKSGRKLKIICDHKETSVTIDYDYGIEHCSYCGALGHYHIDTDAVEWTLPEYLSKQTQS